MFAHVNSEKGGGGDLVEESRIIFTQDLLKYCENKGI